MGGGREGEPRTIGKEFSLRLRELRGLRQGGAGLGEGRGAQAKEVRGAEAAEKVQETGGRTWLGKVKGNVLVTCPVTFWQEDEGDGQRCQGPVSEAQAWLLLPVRDGWQVPRKERACGVL